MKVLAHRGVTRRAPENTMAAFADAVALGVDGIETDVRSTADGVLVLHHDRILTDGRLLAEVAWPDLARSLRSPGVARVEEALSAYPSLLWNLEVKEASAFPALLSLLRRSPPRGEVLLSSFDHAALVAADLPRGMRRGALMAHHPRWEYGLLRELAGEPPEVDVLIWAYELLDLGLIECEADAGLPSWAYGPLTIAEHKQAAGLPLEAVITDHPERMPPPPPPEPPPTP